MKKISFLFAVGIFCYMIYILSGCIISANAYDNMAEAVKEPTELKTVEVQIVRQTPEPMQDVEVYIPPLDEEEKTTVVVEIEPTHIPEEVIVEPIKTLEVDFSILPETVIAWIQVDGNDTINYPVVQSTDNEYYLNHLPNGDYSRGGSIFVDYRNNGFENRHVVVYGHNMKDKSMFSTIKGFQQEEYFNDHRYIYVGTPNGETRVFEIFSCFLTDVEGEETYSAYQVSFKGTEFADWVEETKARSLVSSDVEVTEKSNILTLSTCMSRGNKGERCVVHAVEVLNHK